MKVIRTLLSVAASGLAIYQVSAVPITYQGILFDGVPVYGSVPVSGTVSGPTTASYWTFFGNQGASVTLTGLRLEAAYDPAMWVFAGVFGDTDVFGGSFDSSDAGYLTVADDEISNAGPYGDPQATVTLTLPGTGQYTVAMVNFASGTDDGDGVFPYELTARGVVNPQGVPDAGGTLCLLGLGVACLFGGLRRKN